MRSPLHRQLQIVRSQEFHALIPFPSRRLLHLRFLVSLSFCRSSVPPRMRHFNIAYGTRRVQPKKNIYQTAITLALHQVNAVLTLDRLRGFLARASALLRHGGRAVIPGSLPLLPFSGYGSRVLGFSTAPDWTTMSAELLWRDYACRSSGSFLGQREIGLAGSHRKRR